MPRLILLTGLHKTGTTSLQATCQANVQALRAAGVFYPLLSPAAEGLGGRAANHSRAVGPAFKRQMMRVGGEFRGDALHSSNPNLRAHRDRLLSKLREAGGLDVLLVAEGVSNFSAVELEDLRQWLTDAGFEVRTYCCIRKPVQWLHSLVAQRCFGEFAPRLTIDAAVNEFVRAASIVRSRVDRIERAFPQTVFMDFESSARHAAGPTGRFLELLGVDTTDWKLLRVNTGGSDHAVRLSSCINAAIGHRMQKPGNQEFYLGLDRNHPMLRRIPGPKFQLRLSEAGPLLSLLESENEWLKVRFGDGYFETAIKFDSEPPRLTHEQRTFVEEHLTGMAEPTASIVRHYLEQY
jgi:hypothetical protein